MASAMKRCTSRMFTGFVDAGAAAAVVARMLADAAGGGRQRIVHDHGLERVLQPVFLVQLQEARDVHVQRAGVLARRKRQVLADARRGSGARGCGPRTRAGSAAWWSAPDWARSAPGRTATCRGSCGSARRACPGRSRAAVPRVKLFRMRSALSSPTRQGTHLPQDSECVNSMK